MQKISIATYMSYTKLAKKTNTKFVEELLQDELEL